MGIYLYNSLKNTIEKNNFIRNKKNAVFEFSLRNKWNNNYWDDWIGFRYNQPIFQKFPKVIVGFPWFQFDWHPAQEPYDIGV